MQWILDTCYFLLSRLPIVMESMLLSNLGFSFSTFSDLSPASIYAIQFSVRGLHSARPRPPTMSVSSVVCAASVTASSATLLMLATSGRSSMVTASTGIDTGRGRESARPLNWRGRRSVYRPDSSIWPVSFVQIYNSGRPKQYLHNFGLYYP